METTLKKLTSEDQKLLVEILIRQQYAIEIVSSELNDIEVGVKSTDEVTYNRLVSLYELLRIK
ncbi:antirepressor AbbA [Metabacillus sp. FJAT-53654]|uniref:Antirepressor AbbA n=1 Tax=Metabacillus rhizosphaerae TaxID=3117747 RepID=A0ABZ2MQR3_9BACI